MFMDTINDPHKSDYDKGQFLHVALLVLVVVLIKL